MTTLDVSELTPGNAPLIPKDLLGKFNSYNPRDNDAQWLDYRPVILGLVAASYGNSTKYNPRDVPKIMLTIFRFCLYAESKLGTEPETVANFLDIGTVAAFINEEYAGKSRTQVSSAKRILNFVAEKAQDVELTFSVSKPLESYTYRELSVIGSQWISGQTNQRRKDNARRILSISLGAGMNAKEAMALMGKRVAVRDDFVWLTSPLDGREVPVHPTYDAPLREKIRASEYVLFPDNLGRKKSLAKYLEQMQIDGVPRVSVRRLVCTWQTYLIANGASAVELGAFLAEPQVFKRRRKRLRMTHPDLFTVKETYRLPLGAFHDDFVLIPTMVLEREREVPEWLANSIYGPLGEFDFTAIYPSQEVDDVAPRYPPLRLVHSK
ncbi:hypothetical protein [Corynebacterium camporealensis]